MMNWQGFRRKRSCSKRDIFRYFPEGAEEDHENLKIRKVLSFGI
jgi:hypothetical protein